MDEHKRIQKYMQFFDCPDCDGKIIPEYWDDPTSKTAILKGKCEQEACAKRWDILIELTEI